MRGEAAKSSLPQVVDALVMPLDGLLFPHALEFAPQWVHQVNSTSRQSPLLSVWSSVPCWLSSTLHSQPHADSASVCLQPFSDTDGMCSPCSLQECAHLQVPLVELFAFLVYLLSLASFSHPLPPRLSMPLLADLETTMEHFSFCSCPALNHTCCLFVSLILLGGDLRERISPNDHYAKGNPLPTKHLLSPDQKSPCSFPFFTCPTPVTAPLLGEASMVDNSWQFWSSMNPGRNVPFVLWEDQSTNCT